MKILLAKPRGFCAGVERAVRSVERALKRCGPPVYVLNHIVHNHTVVQTLEDQGAVFVHDLANVPQGATLLFSAHGVGPERWIEARARDLHVIDATCPLVEKVHREARRFAEQDYAIVLIGKAGHDEVTGATGWAPEHIQVVFTEEDVEHLDLSADARVAYITQTTLSVDDCARVIEALRRRFPDIVAPPSDDICYATQNRQRAVRLLAVEADLVLVVGDEASANSTRLAEICRAAGRESHLIGSAAAIEPAWLDGVDTVLVTSGASAPEALVKGVVEYLERLEPCTVDEREVVHEDVHFALPKEIG
ncbi:MAG TPA: 4-hydroxy-3-methylbut-2-enyl diphosphate reductase [Candidatus Hydrogenedentes bacterium]|nr:4-hydroxy-3-methylbut-2-enyl diphosphate reductase [Candidatus Hydrogenedentota bacterium]